MPLYEHDDIYRADYSMTLRKVVDEDEQNYDLWDFDYDIGNDDRKKEFEDLFYEYYMHREIGFETVEKFLQRLKARMLMLAPHYKKIFKAYDRRLNVLSNEKSKSKQKTVFADTPDQDLGFDDDLTYASSVGEEQSEGEGYTNITEVELLEKYREKLRDIMTEFIEEFDDLFMQLY